MAASPELAEELSYPAVAVIQVGGDWYVRVVGPAGEFILTFPVKARAIDFAAEQCERLHLEKYERF